MALAGLPTESALRRALRRAKDGVTLDAIEAEILLHARGEQLTGSARPRPGSGTPGWPRPGAPA